MQVKQVYELANQITAEILGKTELTENDYRDVIDLGQELLNANKVDNYVKALIDRIGRVIFVDRVYKTKAPNVFMDNFEYGSVVEKIDCDLPEATVNTTWDLVDNTSYDDGVFHAPAVRVKFFNSKTTFAVDMSITDVQIKTAFLSNEQMTRFANMIMNRINDKITLDTDALIRSTIANMIGETVYADYNTGSLSAKSGVKAINLLYLYNQAHAGATLTKNNCLENAEFIRFCVEKMQLYKRRLSEYSTLFNCRGKERHTPNELLHFVLLDDFMSKADTILQSSTFHNEFTALPYHDIVSFWQAPGTDYSINNTSKIKMITSANHSIEMDGILGVMFDRDALGINQYDRRVTTKYIASAEFTNYFYKVDTAYFNDLNENMVVFFIA